MVDSEDIVKWVVYKCREEGHPVTEALAAYIVHTTVNPDTSRFFIEDQVKTEDQAKQLVDLAVSRLANSEDPAIETLKMQIAYDAAYVQQEYFQQHLLSVQTQETNGLMDDIINTETRGGNDFEGIAILYKKIFTFLMFKNKQVGLNYAKAMLRPGGGLNSLHAVTNTVLQPGYPASTINTMEREVAAALESVLPRPALRPFVAMSGPEKINQMSELANIVVGIRLFNKEIGKGGIGLESFEDLVNHPSRELGNTVYTEVLNVVEECDDYSLVLGQNLVTDQQQREAYSAELAHSRQFLSYLLALQEDIQTSESLIENLHSRYLRELVQLKDLIGTRTSIPKDQVYPKFDNLSQIYSQMNEEKNKCMLRMELHRILQESREIVKLTMQADLIDRAKQEKVDIEDEDVDESGSSLEVQRLTSENTPDFMHIPLDYQGFCPWSLVENNGLLVPGKPALGVVRYKDRHFVLSSSQAVHDFMQRPQFYLDEAKTVARQHPEIIHLLRMTEEFPECSLTHLLQGKEGMPIFSVTAPLMVDQSNETPVHFVDYYKDPEWHWNEWELRRRALQKANIRNRKTTAAQTESSNYRRDNEAQVYLPKEEETQTGISASTQIENTLTYIVGLRDKRVK